MLKNNFRFQKFCFLPSSLPPFQVFRRLASPERRIRASPWRVPPLESVQLSIWKPDQPLCCCFLCSIFRLQVFRLQIFWCSFLVETKGTKRCKVISPLKEAKPTCSLAFGVGREIKSLAKFPVVLLQLLEKRSNLSTCWK